MPSPTSPSPWWSGPSALPSGPGSLSHRLSTAIVAALSRGEVRPGDTLPSTRSLAAQLGIGRGAVVAAYDELAAAGYVEARMGSGTVVVAGADAATLAQGHLPTESSASPAHEPGDDTSLGSPAPPPGALDLRPGHAEPSLISTRDWRAAWRHAIPDLPGAEALSRLRHHELETALATHLRRFRGVVATPDDVVVVPGASAAFTILTVATGLAGRTVAVEDPGYRRARTAFAEAGARLRPVPVDADGLDPSLLRPGDAAAYLTPAHQYPLGGRIPVARRGALVEQARRAGQLLIEDDYDGEFRYGVPPMPALRATAGGEECVAYVGTASKILTPDLGLAWVVPPAGLVGAVRQAQDRLSLGASPLAARALAHLVAGGALGRHLARASRLYRARRDALVAALRRELPEVRVVGVEAGLHLVVVLDGIGDDLDDRQVASRLQERQIWVEPLSDYWLGPGTPASGLVIGYARLPETRAAAVVGGLARILAA